MESPVSSHRHESFAPISSRNMHFVGHSDMAGRGDGVQIMVHKQHVFVGHSRNEGMTILDASNPSDPKVVNFIAGAPNTRLLHMQIHGDLMVVVNGPNFWAMPQFQDRSNYFSGSIAEKVSASGVTFEAGIRTYDVSNPAEPREIGFMPTGGLGPHRIWYDGGKFAYASIHFEGFSDHIFTAIDMSDPAKLEIVGRWWIDGMHIAARETPTWGPSHRYGVHHGLVSGDYAFCAWRDAGFVILDISDRTNMKPLARRHWTGANGGNTHSCLPLLDRDLLIVADEANFQNCEQGHRFVWVVDVRDKTNPISIATMPEPDEADYCAKGGAFGPHNLHENRQGSMQSSTLIFATYHNAGVRAFDIANPYRPKAVGHFVPRDPVGQTAQQTKAQQPIQSTDVYVDPEGLMYVTDKNAGLYILQFDGG